MTPKIMSKFEMPAQVVERAGQLGQRIRIARIRRGWSVADLASKVGINRNALTALKLGRPGTAIGVCFTVLWALAWINPWTPSQTSTPTCTAKR
jgi:DNA-binding XRE family transcriptional regulator